jgi:hypothetical protein
VCAKERGALDPSSDLDAALKFVVERINEQADRSGDPLTQEQLALLRDLPIRNGASLFGSGAFWSPATPIPRDRNYEKLCALGRAAYTEASKKDPGILEWEFASAVLLFHSHPMWTLLYHAGVRNQRPGLEPLLLALWAVVLIVTLEGTAVALNLHSDHTTVTWIAICAELIPLALLTRWGVRRTQRWRLEFEMERCRAGLNSSHEKSELLQTK